jgi:hypothetical protein
MRLSPTDVPLPGYCSAVTAKATRAQNDVLAGLEVLFCLIDLDNDANHAPLMGCLRVILFSECMQRPSC